MNAVCGAKLARLSIERGRRDERTSRYLIRRHDTQQFAHRFWTDLMLVLAFALNNIHDLAGVPGRIKHDIDSTIGTVALRVSLKATDAKVLGAQLLEALPVY